MTLSTPRLSHLLLVGFLTLGLVLAGCGDDDPVSPDPDPPDNDDPPEVTTIADLVAEDDNFSTLLGHLEDEDLVGDLDDEDATFTVFAPTNDAFAAANFNQFTFSEREAILRYHVLTDAVDSSVLVDALTDAEAEFSVETLQGEEMTFTGTFDDEGNLTGININGDQASIDLGNVDIEALDSFIHLIDGVTLPPSFTDENGDNGDNGAV